MRGLDCNNYVTHRTSPEFIAVENSCSDKRPSLALPWSGEREQPDAGKSIDFVSWKFVHRAAQGSDRQPASCERSVKVAARRDLIQGRAVKGE